MVVANHSKSSFKTINVFRLNASIFEKNDLILGYVYNSYHIILYYKMNSSSNNNNSVIIPILHKQNMQKVLNAINGIKCDVCSAHLCDKEYKDASMIRRGIYVCSFTCASIALPIYKDVP